MNSKNTKKQLLWQKIFRKNPAVTHNFIRFLAPCQNLEKTNDQISRKRSDRLREVRTDTIL